MNRLVIIDGNAIIHRAYHAIPPMNTKSGLMVNAVYGFTSMLLKTLKDLKPTHLAVTFDVAGGSHARLKRYDQYKATRVKADPELYSQIPLVHDLVRAFKFPIFEQEGYEADDVIGTLVEINKKLAQNKELEIFIVTGDMDTLQLVHDGIKVYTLKKGLSDTVIYDEKAVKDRYGFGPELMLDYKALRGDASDNIPGVPGIGAKTATDLIKEFGSLKNIYKQLTTSKEQLTKKIKPGVLQKLIAGEESAEMSYELSKLDNAVPGLNFKLEDCAIKELDRGPITALFQKLEFISLLKRLPGSPDTAEEKKPKIKKSQKLIDFIFTEIKSTSEVKNLVEKILIAKEFACRAAFSGNDVFSGNLNGFVIVVGNEGFFVPNNLNQYPVGAGLPRPYVIDGIFTNPEITVIGHDLKQLVKILTIHSSPFAKGEPARPQRLRRSEVGRGGGLACHLFDTMIASYLLQPGSRAHDSAAIILKTLGKELTAGSGQESLFGFDARAAAQELFYLATAGKILKQELESANNLGLFTNVEMPLIKVLVAMELAGISIDRVKLGGLSTDVAEAIKNLTQKIYKLAGMEFNIASPLQLREVLFDKLQIPTAGLKKGKTGLSTDAEQLEKLRGVHLVVDEIQEYRELAKLQNTYIDVLPTLINKTTGRIHTTFNQAVTATGRLSSSEPNLQNIPVRTALGRAIRSAFIAPPGKVLLSADYSQIELRIVASLAKDKRLMEIFEAGEDVHTATAAAIHGVPLKDVSKEMRRSAKEVNFGILYGMGAYGLAWRAEIPHAEARDFIKKYFSEFSGVKKYLDGTLQFTRENGYCETLFGRRRYIPELTASNFQLRSAAERMAINHPIQGTAADLMKMAMIAVASKVPARLRYGEAVAGRQSLGSKVQLLLQVHDELIFEVDKNSATEVGALVKDIMENVVKLLVPVRVEVKAGKNWNELETIKL
ncbi:MAG: DNA polymerase I [Candidatus Magasanikbacteria bacterium]|nr:DNA polymerase I [Candidatus Magasanikbacteria bacterium]